MAKIAVLDNNMINMIAAGEVIERPASVVKELLENSIDADSTKIVLRVEDGGRKLISVTDNGYGISEDDLLTAFLPHATSKVRTSDDLDGIVTMGFRGEALASIASVSKLSITSRTPDSIQANRLEIDCGQREQIVPCSGDVGTTIEVRNLFYKLPARRKFLRTANTEMTHINEFFTRIALANKSLDMTLIHNGRELHRLTPTQTIRQRIAQLVGPEICDDLIETKSDEKSMSIYALIGKPAKARGNNKYQYIFLNNRYIRDRFISHAMKEAYRGLMEPNKYPIAYLFIEMDPSDLDVNVHPTKIEVRFHNSNMIHSQVLAVLREKLLSLNLDVEVKLPSPVNLNSDSPISSEEETRRKRISNAMENFFKDHKPSSQSQQNFGFSGSHSTSATQTFTRPSSGTTPTHHYPATAAPHQQYTQSAGDQTVAPALTGRFLQVHNSYILTQTEQGFVIIDQHALHERIIYDKLSRNISKGALESQRLLIPETFPVTNADLETVNKNSEFITKLGIELEPFGPDTMAIYAFPTMLNKAEPVDFVRELIDKLADKTPGLDAETLLHEILDMASCKAAIKAGQPLSQQEMNQLLTDKDSVEKSSRCPHGRPTTIKFTLEELEKQFKRTGF